MLFDVDRAFRAKLRKVSEKHHPKAKRNWLDEKPVRGEWKLCLVSLGRKIRLRPGFVRRLASLENPSGFPVVFDQDSFRPVRSALVSGLEQLASISR